MPFAQGFAALSPSLERHVGTAETLDDMLDRLCQYEGSIEHSALCSTMYYRSWRELDSAISVHLPLEL